MQDLDVNTLFVATIIIVFGALVTLFSQWRTQTRYKGAGFWVIGMTSIVVGYLLLWLRGDIDDFFSIIVGNLAILCGLIIILRGTSVFAGRLPSKPIELFLVPITALLFLYFTYVDSNAGIRIIILSLSTIVVTVAIVITLLRDRSKPWWSAGCGVATIFGLLGISMLVRIPLTLLETSDYSFEQAPAADAAVFLFLIFI
ncbi:MAG: hypothetical protein JKX94_00760, partial [Sneathiella sp.]|nr:hypothetical protein [Sneathiella sp.]